MVQDQTLSLSQGTYLEHSRMITTIYRFLTLGNLPAKISIDLYSHTDGSCSLLRYNTYVYSKNRRVNTATSTFFFNCPTLRYASTILDILTLRCTHDGSLSGHMAYQIIKSLVSRNRARSRMYSNTLQRTQLAKRYGRNS